MSETGASNRNCVEVVFSVVMALGLRQECGLFAIGEECATRMTRACRLKDWTALPCWQKEAFQTEPDIATPTIQLLHKEGVAKAEDCVDVVVAYAVKHHCDRPTWLS
jgi:hypothetical protein